MNKTPRRDQRPTSANPAPVVSGNAPGGSTASTKVSSGAGGQVLSESGLIQQQVNALQILVRISIWSKNTQNCFAYNSATKYPDDPYVLVTFIHIYNISAFYWSNFDQTFWTQFFLDHDFCRPKCSWAKLIQTHIFLMQVRLG